jgi:hypothetical protein
MPKIVNKKETNLRTAAVDMSKREVCFLLEAYNTWLGLYQATRAHRKILEEESLKQDNIKEIHRSVRRLRNSISTFLGIWVENYPTAKYFKDNIGGVGPVIAAGLAAYIDIDKCKNHYSSLWKFAGQNPNSRPPIQKIADEIIQEALDKFEHKHGDNPARPHEDHMRYIASKIERPYKKFAKMCSTTKGKTTWPKLYTAMKRPQYSIPLRRICLSLGNDIIKHKSIYQDLFRERYMKEYKKNENGDYAKVARKCLRDFNHDKRKQAYKCYIQGKLPDGHLRNRAKRWSVKVLLAHYYMIEYYIRHGKAPPDVYALDVLNGKRKIHVPGDWKKFVSEVRKRRLR